MSDQRPKPLELALSVFRVTGLALYSLGWFVVWNLWRMKMSVGVGIIAFGMIWMAGYAHSWNIFWPAVCMMLLALACAYIDGWDMYPAMRRYFKAKTKKQEEWFQKKMAELDAAEAEDAAE